jgi:YD repeat-containing protein
VREHGRREKYNSYYNSLTSAQKTMIYAYDSISRRTSLQASNSYLATYNYDVANRLAKIVKDGQNYSFSYDNANRMAGMTMPNEVASQYGFDAASRLSQILHKKSGQTLKSLGYLFDAADQITQISGMSSNTPEDSVVASASTNANNQYTVVDGQTVSHDANGNQVAQGPVSYQWDARNCKTQRGSDESLEGGGSPGLKIVEGTGTRERLC